MIRQSVYPVPFAVERADPSVFAWDFNGKPMFMFIATDDTDGNCVDPNDGRTHMPLRIAIPSKRFPTPRVDGPRRSICSHAAISIAKIVR